jgi:hypothetical protein
MIMTENPTPLIPPGSSQLLSNATPVPPPEQAGDSSGEIQCVCEFTEDDGYTICCDKCETWQHIACMQLQEDNLPSKYLCSNCLPRSIDTRRARELQRQRRREEKNNRKKRSSTVSHKKKESNGLNGISGKTTQGGEKSAIVKLPSPREPQPTTSRKRNQRSSHPTAGSAANAAGSASESPAYFPNCEVESDTEMEKYKYEFIDLSHENKYADDGVRDFLSQFVDPKSTPRSPGTCDRTKHFTGQDFGPTVFPRAAVKELPDSSKSYSEHTRWSYVLEVPCPRGKPVALFKGKVGLQNSYKNEPINQYALWHHPKPYVIFHPELPIYIDARRCGSEARFVRRSCNPNLDIRTIVVDDTSVWFGLFAAESLKPGTELTIGWDWNGSRQLQHLASEGFDFSKLTPDEMKQAAVWVDNLLQKMGDCACAGGNDCLLVRIKKSGGIESTMPKHRLTNGSGRRRVKRNASADSSASQEAITSDLNGLSMETDDDSATTIKAKSRSRDMTPSLLTHEMDIDTAAMTGREARKFKEILSCIEKQEQQVPPNKRRRQNGSGRSASPGAPEESRKSKSQSSPSTSPSLSTGREVSVVDAGTGRRSSPGSTTSNDDRRSRKSRSTAESGISSASSKVRQKVRKISAVNYVDNSVQTEPDDSLPWWKQPVQMFLPRPPRLPLRKRLMQSLLRDRELAAAAAATAAAAAAAPLAEKRKLDSMEEPAVSLQPLKIAKTSEGVKIEALSPILPYGGLNTSPDNDASLSPRSGPPLGELFADAEKPREGASGRMNPPPNGVHVVNKPPTNGQRNPGLHLQLPAVTLFPNAPVTPLNQGTLTPGTGSAVSPFCNPIFSPSVIASVSTSASASSPSPTKTKKLSLQDYGKRKHKSIDAPMEKKDDSKTMLRSADPSAPKTLPFLSVPNPGEALPPPPPPPPPSQSTPVDSKIIPERTGVR